ncbi:interferon-induced protein 44-like [Sardina pilchardus]|uniref:interferon-induced protein 44-like n=1 Tax=Sardina pilchardus TaxID=27697 RepID=UPI002E157E6B
MKDNLRRIQTCTPDVKHLRILVHGPVGAGKSSFINSIDSIFQGRLTSGAIVDAATGHSFTKTFQTHYIKDEIHHGFLTFAFCDIMGLELGQSEGVQTEDLSKVLKGHIKDGYTEQMDIPKE